MKSPEWFFTAVYWILWIFCWRFVISDGANEYFLTRFDVIIFFNNILLSPRLCLSNLKWIKNKISSQQIQNW